jgi:hypothetical protein
MKWTDIVWELLDNALYLLHLAAVVLVLGAAIACPVLLWLLLVEVRDVRKHVEKDVTVIEPHCRRCDPDGPGPVLPRVLPRLRRLGEEAAE